MHKKQKNVQTLTEPSWIDLSTLFEVGKVFVIEGFGFQIKRAYIKANKKGQLDLRIKYVGLKKDSFPQTKPKYQDT